MRRARYYDIEGAPITHERWLELFDSEYGALAMDTVGGAEVSTVWLGLDHNFLGDGPPLIFETRVFGSVLDGYTRRHPDKATALAGHRLAVEIAKPENQSE